MSEFAEFALAAPVVVHDRDIAVDDPENDPECTIVGQVVRVERESPTTLCVFYTVDPLLYSTLEVQQGEQHGNIVACGENVEVSLQLVPRRARA